MHDLRFVQGTRAADSEIHGGDVSLRWDFLLQLRALFLGLCGALRYLARNLLRMNIIDFSFSGENHSFFIIFR